MKCVSISDDSLGSMCVADFLNLKKCPNLLLAIAFWIFNDCRAEWDANSSFWLENPYIDLLVPADDDQETIYGILQDLYYDERYLEENESDDESSESEDESSESEGEPVQITNNMTDLSGDPQ